MNDQAPFQFHIALVGDGSEVASRVEAVLTEAGFHCVRVVLDLEGLRQAAEIKPNAIVLIECGEAQEEWVLNFVEGNPSAPLVLAICGSSLLSKAPDWLFDVVAPSEIETALVHRLNRALAFADMRALSAERIEKLGLSRAQIGLLSMIDMVTGLFNRRYFTKHLNESFAAATRYNRPLTMLLVRVDNLSELVDGLGRELANDVLDTMAHTLVSVIRRADTAARIDEDLFGFLLPETNQQGGNLLVPRLLGQLDKTVFPYQAEVTVSTALVQLSQSHQAPESLLEEGMSKLPARL